MRTLFLNKKCLFLLVIIGMIFGARWLSRPTYKGHGIEWWFDQYADDFTFSVQRHYLPPTSRQEDALEAFRHFGKPGVEYLVDQFAIGFDPPVMFPIVYQVLESFPWNRNLKAKQQDRWMYGSEAAVELLNELGIPYDWADQLGREAVRASSHRNAMAMEVHLLSVATNEFDQLSKRFSAGLTHRDDWYVQLCLKTLVEKNLNTDAVIPLLLERDLTRISNGALVLRYAAVAPKSPRIRAKLELLIDSENLNTAFMAALAGMYSVDLHDRSLAVIQSVFDKASAMEDGYRKHLYFMLTLLKIWPHSLGDIMPLLKDLAGSSDAAFISVIEILMDHQEDVTPFLPKMRQLINQQNLPADFREVEKVLLAFFLLKHDFNDPAVWSFLDQAMAGAGIALGEIAHFEGSIVQLLAPHISPAQSILKKYPKANQEVSLGSMATARRYLSKYGLLNVKTSQTTISETKH